MPWPIPDLQLEPVPPGFRPRDMVILLLLALLSGVLFALLHMYIKPGSKPAEALGLGASIGGLLLYAGFSMLAVVVELPRFRSAQWNLLRIQRLRQDQRWTHSPLALIASHALLPEPDAAARMAGLETPPLEAATARQILFADETLAAGPFRFERICKELLLPLAPQLRRLGSAPLGLEIVVWLQCTTPWGEQQQRLFDACWQEASLPRYAALQQVPADAGPDWQEQLRKSDSHAHLLLALQYHANEQDSGPEAAVALLLTTGWRAKHSQLPVCNRLYRPCSLRQQHSADDFRRWATRGQQPRNLVGQLWLCGLDKTQQHGVKTLARDHALPLRQNPPSLGVLDLQVALGIKGPLLPWLALALASELVACQQGSQAIASHHQGKVWLQMTGMAPAQWQPFGSLADVPAVPLLCLVLAVWLLAMLLALLPESLPPDPDNYLLYWLAGLLALLAFGAPFLYAYLCRERWRYQFAQEVYACTPAKE